MDPHFVSKLQEPSPSSRETEPVTAVYETQRINPRRKYHRQETGPSHERKQAADNESGNSMSESEEHELSEVGPDAGSDADEETGLTGKERQKHLRPGRRRDELVARIAGDIRPSKVDVASVNKTVLQKLVVNGVLIGLWYLFSLSISLYNKWMFSSDHLDFHFPLFTTSLHMVVQFLLATLVLLIFPSLRPKKQQLHHPLTQPPPAPKPLITPLFYATRLIPCGSTTSLDIGLGNTSLRYITLTFYTMCKSSVLGFVLVFAFLFRLETPNLRLILIILTMSVGVFLMVAGETTFNALGFALAISASFFSGFRWALTQILLLRHPATANPFATMFWLAPIMFVTLFLIAIVSETPAAVITGIHVLTAEHGIFKALVLLIFPGALAFCLTTSEFALLQRTNVVTLSICGIFKEVVTISAAGAVFGDELTPINIGGLCVTLASIAAYNYLKISKMRREAREKAERDQKGEGGSLEEDDFELDLTDEEEDEDDTRSRNARVSNDLDLQQQQSGVEREQDAVCGHIGNDGIT